jgi:hypothetical protein
MTSDHGIDAGMGSGMASREGTLPVWVLYEDFALQGLRWNVNTNDQKGIRDQGSDNNPWSCKHVKFKNGQIVYNKNIVDRQGGAPTDYTNFLIVGVEGDSYLVVETNTTKLCDPPEAYPIDRMDLWYEVLPS